jgi:hypothetical protein
MSAARGCAPGHTPDLGDNTDIGPRSTARGSCQLLTELLGELAAAPHPELVVGVAEVGLDGLDGDEEQLGDLAVGLVGRRQLRHPAFSGGQGGRAHEHAAPHPVPGGAQLQARLGLAERLLLAAESVQAQRRL